jgi:hypothetical protein
LTAGEVAEMSRPSAAQPILPSTAPLDKATSGLVWRCMLIATVSTTDGTALIACF